MSYELESRVGRGIAWWVHGVARHAVWVVVGMMLGTALILRYASGNLGIEGATDALFSRDLPFRQAQLRYYEAFPTQYENMFVVIDAPTPERAGEIATELADRLQAEPRFFHEVYLPGGGDFFEEHAFLYLDTDKLQDLADRLAEAQPYLAELSRDRSLDGLTSMMARGARAVREGDVGGTQLVAIFDRFADALRARIAGKDYHLSWAEVLAGGSFDVDGRRRFLLVQPVLDFNDVQPAKNSILAVRRIADELGLNAEKGVRVRITGDVALSYEEMETVRSQAAMAGLASFVLVGVILFAALRSSLLVLSTLLTLLVGLVWTAGFTTVAIGHLNLISVSFAVLFIGLGVDFGIHLCIRYRELLGHGFSHMDAITETARGVGSSIFLCAATTAIGFFAFVPTDFVGVAELGLISGAGMFISLFCTLTLLPALLSLRPLAPGTGSADDVRWTDGALATLPLRHPRAVRATALTLGLMAVFLLPEARFDNNPLHVRDPSTESVRTFKELLEKGSNSPWSLNAVAKNLESAQILAARLRALDVVGRVVTVADYIPTDQDEKLGIIEDVAMFLAPPTDPQGRPRPVAPSVHVARLEQLAAELQKLEHDAPEPKVARSARELHTAITSFLADPGTLRNPGVAFGALESSVLGTLPEQLRILNAALHAGRVTLQNLPDALLERMVATDGRVRIEIFPSDDLKDQAALTAFVDGVKQVVPQVAGSAAEILESGRTVVAALREALLSALVVITLFLLLLWRRIDDTALVLVPLGLAAAFTVAASVLANIPFNFADVIVLPLLLGIGVDSGIHLVHRARVSGNRDLNLLSTSTARAVVYSALTTIASFGSLGFARHQGLATLGRLLTLGVSFTVLCNLIVLPSLIVLHSKARREVTTPQPARSS